MNVKMVQSSCMYPYLTSLYLTSYVRKVYLSQPPRFFPVPRPHSGQYIIFTCVALDSSLLWQCLTCPLFLMTLAVLRSTDKELRRMSLNWDLLMFSHG